MSQQSLRALVVLLASLPLLALLVARPARPTVERPNPDAVAQGSDDRQLEFWCSSLRLDTFDRDKDIVIPPVPPPNLFRLDNPWSYKPGFFDSDIPVDVFIRPVRGEKSKGAAPQYLRYFIGDDQTWVDQYWQERGPPPPPIGG